jgi:hypothetical protein
MLRHTRILALAALVVAGSTAAGAAQTPGNANAAPAPSASPLREIGHATANALCSTLTRGVVPLLVGTERNDEAISAGHRGLSKMDSDSALHMSDAALELDRRYVRQVADVLAHNLDLMKKLLASDAFPVKISDSDDQAAAIVKAHLEDIVAKQKDALNLMDGTIETDYLGQMQSERNTSMDAATGNPASAPSASPLGGGGGGYLSVAGLQNTGSFPDYRLTTGSTRGHTMYAVIVGQLEGTQLNLASDERQVDHDVITAVSLCKAETQTPAASPTP